MYYCMLNLLFNHVVVKQSGGHVHFPSNFDLLIKKPLLFKVEVKIASSSQLEFYWYA